MNLTNRLMLIVSAETDGAVRELKQLSGQASKSGDAVEGLQSKSKVMGTALKAAAVAGAGYAAMKLVQFGQSAINAASDLSESMSLSQRIFQGNARDIQQWAKQGATSFGLSTNAALSSATTIGNALQNLGYDMDDAAKSTKSLIQRAGDMASAFNTTVPDAVAAISAALRGETEPIRRYGVFLQEAQVKAQALSMGLYDGTGAMTAHAKAAATEAIIIRDTNKIAGDFALTSDGLANSQRILAAETENFKAALGESLAPVMAQAVGTAGDLLGAFNDLDPSVQQNVVKIGLLTGAVGVAIPMLSMMKNSVDNLGGGMAALSTSLKIATAAAIAFTAVEVFNKWREFSQLGAEDVKFESVEAIKKEIADLEHYAEIKRKVEEESFAAFRHAAIWDPENREYVGASLNMFEEASDIEDKIARRKAVIADYTQAMEQAAMKTGKSVALLSTMPNAIGALGLSADTGAQYLYHLSLSEDEAASKAAILAAATEQAGEATEGTNEELSTIAETLQTAKDKAKAYSDVINTLSGSQYDVTAATMAWEDALQAATDKTKDAEGNVKGLTSAFDTSSDEGQKNIKLVKEMRDAAIEHAAAVYKQTGDIDAANAVLKAESDAMLKAATDAGIHTEAVDGLVGIINELPPEVVAKIKADIANAMAGVATVQGAMAGLGQRVTVVTALIDIGYTKGSAERLYRMEKALSADATPVGPYVPRQADGGLITGRGGPRSDSIGPVMLSNGEYVIQASAVDKYGVKMFDAINAEKFAGGGHVGRRSLEEFIRDHPRPEAPRRRYVHDRYAKRSVAKALPRAERPTREAFPLLRREDANRGDLGTFTLVIRDDFGVERLRRQIRVGYGGNVSAALGRLT